MSDHFDNRKDSPAIRAATRAFSQSLLEELLPDMRLAARGIGYALAEHGTQARDIDLLAAPWTENAADPDELVDVLLGALRAKLGNAFVYARKNDGETIREWGQKPHGRRAIILHLPGFCPEIDLSVMPRIPKEASE